MKNFWKKICLLAIIFVSMFGFAGCGDAGTEVSVDLDGDGKISSWETIFDAKALSEREKLGTVVEIGSLSELKAIDGTAINTAYVLTNNIDCNGEALSINLGSSNKLYGNNKVIKNYNLGKVSLSEGKENADGEKIVPTYNSGFESYVKGKNAHALLYNGAGVYDLRLFMGKEEIKASASTTGESYSVSNLLGIRNVDNIEVKGSIGFSFVDDSNNLAIVKISMLSDEAVIYDPNDADSLYSASSISNVKIDGKINYTSKTGEQSEGNVFIGGVASSLGKYSEVSGVEANLDLDISLKRGSSTLNSGMVVGENQGFVTSAKTQGNFNVVYEERVEINCGGIVGSNNASGLQELGVAEVKNSSTTANITFTSGVEDHRLAGTNSSAYVGGIVGSNYGGIINYATNDATISAVDTRYVCVGGIAGRSENGIIDTAITRGSINIENSNNTEGASVVGKAYKGIIQHVLSTTPINVDNTKSNVAQLKLGMAVVCEDEVDAAEIAKENSDETEKITFYKSDNSPLFDGVLVGSGYVVKVSSANANDKCIYELGLRNKYYKNVIDPQTEIESLQTVVPDMFKDIYYLSNYKVTEFVVKEDGQTEKIIDFTCAVNKNNKDDKLVDPANDSVVFKPNWYVNNLGFKYGLNHNEVDLSGVSNETKFASLSTIKFTLNSDNANTKYFENKKLNGELKVYDGRIDDVYYYNNYVYNANDELFSYLNALVKNGKNGIVKPLLINSRYFETSATSQLPEEDGENEGTSVKITPSILYFAENVRNVLRLTYDAVTFDILNKDNVSILNSDNYYGDYVNIDGACKVRFSFKGMTSKYSIDFDCSLAYIDGTTGGYTYPCVVDPETPYHLNMVYVTFGAMLIVG